jgi:vitamin B12 transporter
MACAAVLVSSSSAQAQTNELPEVFVTANRIGQELDSVLSEVDVLKKTDLENMGNANLTQALSKLPGFQGISYGQNAVYLRGTESHMTSVFIEGIRIETHDGLHLGGGAPWEMLPLEMVDRLEVVKGPASAMYGSDAMGGVVQLFGRKASADDRPSLTQSFGSFGLKQTTGQLSGKQQAFDYALMLSTSSSDGYDTRPDLVHSPSTEGSSKEVGMVKLGYDLDRSNRLEWVGFKSNQRYRTAACILDPATWECTTDPSVDIQNHNQIVATGLQWQVGLSDKQIIRARVNTSNVAANSDAPNSSDLVWNYKSTFRTFALDHEYLSELGQVTALIERKQDQFRADANENIPFGISNAAVDASRSQNAAGVGYFLHQSRHTVNASLRLDDYSHFATHQSYSLAYGYEIFPDWSVSAGQSTGFKAPTLEQMHGQFGSVSLLPETNESKEIGVRYSRGITKSRLSLFDNRIKNLISSRQTATNCDAGWFCYFNVGRVHIQGISLTGQTIMDEVNLQSSLDLLNPVDEITGKQLALRSKQSFRFAADKAVATTRLGLEYQYMGKRFDDAKNAVSFPAYHLVHVWSKTTLSPAWTWMNRIDNLFDQKYQQLGCTIGGVNSCNYAMPGVTFFTAIQWQPK